MRDRAPKTVKMPFFCLLKSSFWWSFNRDPALLIILVIFEYRLGPLVVKQSNCFRFIMNKVQFFLFFKIYSVSRTFPLCLLSRFCIVMHGYTSKSQTTCKCMYVTMGNKAHEGIACIKNITSDVSCAAEAKNLKESDFSVSPQLRVSLPPQFNQHLLGTDKTALEDKGLCSNGSGLHRFLLHYASFGNQLSH